MDSLQIFVKTPTGKALQISTDLVRPISALKKQISATILEELRESVDPSQQLLLHKGKLRILCTEIYSTDATTCPISGCDTSLHGLSRDSLPINWIASQFCDPKKTENLKCCQICEEGGSQTTATFWCESCAKVCGPQFFCGACEVAEHANRLAKNHIRVPIGHSKILSILDCAEHKIPQDWYCLDDSKFICRLCLTQHQSHKTKPVVERMEDLRKELKSSVTSFPVTIFEQRDEIHRTAKKEKGEEIKQLETKIQAIKAEVAEIDKHILANEETKQQTNSAAVILTRTIEELSGDDLFDQTKLETLQTRIKAISKIGATPGLHHPRPVIKDRYVWKSTIGSVGKTAGKFNFPFASAINAEGEIFVVDFNNHRIQVFTPAGKYLKSIGQKGKADGLFNNPIYLTFDNHWNLIVVDSYNHRLQVFDTDCKFKLKFGSMGSAEGQFNEPSCCAVDNEGNLVVCDYKNDRIQIFNEAGTFLRGFGSLGRDHGGQFHRPSGVAVGPDNTIVVCDSNNHKIQIFNNWGQCIRSFGTEGKADGQFSFPWGVAVDNDGKILVVDQWNNRVQIFTRLGVFLQKVGTKGDKDGQLFDPRNVTIAPNGSLIISESTNNRVQIFDAPP